MAGFFYFVIMLVYILTLLSILSPPPKVKAPAGTAQVPGSRNLFLDKREVSNADYRKYLLEVSHHESGSLETALPDSLCWYSAYGVSFSDPDGQFENYPVVGLKREQVEAYCRWRSSYVSNREKRDVSYSLPKFRTYKMTVKEDDGRQLAEGLYSTALNFHGFLGLCDNASEMLDAQGIALRGNDAPCLSLMPIEGLPSDLGFRCQAEVR